MGEEWRNINEFDGLYQISNFGRVRNAKNNRLLSPSDNGRGYLMISFQIQRKRYPRYIHRLVAEAFCQKETGCEYVNHIDHDRKNNNSENLEWVTQRQNVRLSSHLMKRWSKGTTAEPCIYRSPENSFRIVVDGKEYPRRKTIEEAIILRDSITAGGVN